MFFTVFNSFFPQFCEELKSTDLIIRLFLYNIKKFIICPFTAIIKEDLLL